MGESADRIRRGRALLARSPHAVERLASTEWRVRSSRGGGYYRVWVDGGEYLCECDDFEGTRQPCKHIYAAYAFEYPDHPLKATPGEPIEPKKRYRQNNPAYDLGQTNEFPLFREILRSLCSEIADPARDPTAPGRPRIPYRDAVFLTILKVYSQMSMRRARGLMDVCARDFVSKMPASFDLPSHILRDPLSAEILDGLVRRSSLPLRVLEETFAIDSSGFSTSSFGPYNQEAHNTGQRHQFVKAHVAVGVKTHVVAAAIVTDSHAGDCPQFPGLLERLKDSGFVVKETVADKAYLSRENADVAEALGVAAYIPMRRNMTGQSRGSSAFRRVCQRFLEFREEFDRHYHQRSNVEATFKAIKQKLGENLRSRRPLSQQNELRAKIVAYNITVLIHEMYERGIQTPFLEE